MSAENELLHAYREWHRLALAERRAIQTRNWNLLADCQLAIAGLQSQVGGLTRQAHAEWQRNGLNPAEKKPGVHVFVHALIELTRQNQLMLQSARATAQERLADLSEARRNLKLLQRSYQSTDSTWSCVS
jgi:hypothetical protein